MKISFTLVEEQLKSYISSFWVYESTTGIPATDARLIVPNGTAKIIIPIENPLFAIVGQKTIESKEHHIYLAGLCENPTKITADVKKTVTLGMEVTPKGLYRFFNLSMHEMTNQLFTFEDLFGTWGAQLEDKLANSENIQEKIVLIQNTLIKLLNKNCKNYSLLDYTIDAINKSQGMISINELEKKTGYSRRYIDILFKEHIGMSPKLLSSIIRFQRFYQPWVQKELQTFIKDNLYTYYYDQSHFIKEFKRFTGFTPRKFSEINNEFGRLFYI